jgi:NADPH-dependent 2,4-dienoyl-CoA reductase/sulfur reductase-like enzyme/rhodanese-related sulfurtransferase
LDLIFQENPTGNVMRIAVIGSVAAGTSAGAKARRITEDGEITIFEKDMDISYSACGTPYYISDLITDRKLLAPRDVAFFKKNYNIDILIGHEVLKILAEEKLLEVKNLATRETFKHPYDQLVIATGAVPVSPPIKGIDAPNVFPLRTVASADKLKMFIKESKPSQGVIVGSGFIGMEMAETLVQLGIKTVIVEKAAQVVPSLDPDVARWVEKHLIEKGVELFLADGLVALGTNEGGVYQVVTESGRNIPADFVIMAIGVKPNVALAKAAGIEIGETGAIKVNKYLETSIKGIYAAGDCAESFSRITGHPVYYPQGSIANKMGRIVGQNMFGSQVEFLGGLGTRIFKVFDLAVGQTGLTENEAKRSGYEVVTVHNIKPNQQPYYPGGGDLLIKAVADRKTGRMLGAQAVGSHGVDKRIDVFATGISLEIKTDEWFQIDLGYAPPYATTKDPVTYTGMILTNELEGKIHLISPEELEQKKVDGCPLMIIDVRVPEEYAAGHVPGALNIPLANLRQRIDELDPAVDTVTYCNAGTSGNAAQNILLNHGFKSVSNISGGYKNWKMLSRDTML